MWVRSEVVMLTFGGPRKVEVRDGTRLTNLKYKAEAYNGKGYLAAAGPHLFVNLTKSFSSTFQSLSGKHNTRCMHKTVSLRPFLAFIHVYLLAPLSAVPLGNTSAFVGKSAEKVWR